MPLATKPDRKNKIDHWVQPKYWAPNAHLGPPHATATQYFTVDDVDALWDGVKRHCRAEWGPEDMPYGLREFAIKDPNGYLLSFGSPLEIKNSARS
jgi:hypothetical protein